MGAVKKFSKEMNLKKCLPLRIYLGGWSFAFFVSIGVLAIGVIEKTEKTSTQIPEEDKTKKQIALVLVIIGSILLFISTWRLFVLIRKYLNLCPEMFLGEVVLTMMFD